jgi:membrane fusion protein, multidrug efflux system
MLLKFPPLRTALALALPVLLAACQSETAAPARGPVEVGIMTLVTQPITLQSELPGRAKAAQSSEVRPQVGGIVQARLFEEGARVKAGQLLYRIDASSYRALHEQARAALANAEASLSSAKLKHERYGDLVKIDGVSQQDADDAQASYRQAVATMAEKKAALESARIDLEHTAVTAPISGRIGISSVTPGALVTAGQTTALATIRALDPIYVDLTQSSAQLLRLRKLLSAEGAKSGSTRVRLKLEDGSDYARSGVLKFQEVAVDESSGSVTLRAEFPNPDGQLLPGMYVRAVLDEAQDNAALLAPQRAVTRDPKGNATALVLSADNKVEQRTLQTERAIGDQWLVSAGLAAGERLIVEGLNKIRVGDTVKPVPLSDKVAGKVAGQTAPAKAATAAASAASAASARTGG